MSSEDIELLRLLIKAKELGISKEDIERLKGLPPPKTLTNVEPSENLEQVFKPQSPFDDLSEEDILYWATPYFDELAVKKEKQKQGRGDLESKERLGNQGEK